jgi:2-keto-3-deoxy-L-rhamnonate aldolase RhmA
MVRLQSPALERLEAGELSIGVGIRVSRTIDIVRMMRSCGFDWLFLDLEHSALPLEVAASMSLAALDAGITPLVRIPAGDFATASRLLDAGAMGVVHPHIETPEDAQRMVDELRFAPLGNRGAMGSGTIPQFAYRSIELNESLAELNRTMLLVAMLETPAAIARADDIAAVKGLDVVMIGTNDLTYASGHSGDPGHPEIIRAYETVAAACKKHGKYFGAAGVNDHALIARFVGMGVRFLLGAVEIRLLMSAGSKAVASLREIKTVSA